jgi:hypothetical protein
MLGRESGPLPQFGTVEYQPEPGDDRCKTCDRSIVGQYYRVNGAIACVICAEKVSGLLPRDTHGAFGRGLLFAIGGAILGLILYSAVSIMTGLEIGYVSLAVGYIVGRAFMTGSWGIGGKRYQVAAALLTYAAVSMSAVPISLYHTSQSPAAQTEGGETRNVPSDRPSPDSPTGLITALLYLGAIGLVSPFLELAEPLRGLIGLVILFVGMQIAWKKTAGVKISILGPFKA